MQVTFIDDDVSQLNVFGNLNINSADLLLIFDQEFIPTLNTSFDVLTWSLTRTGTFDNILVDELLGDALPAGLSFLSSYDPAGAAGALQITIVPGPSWGWVVSLSSGAFGAEAEDISEERWNVLPDRRSLSLHSEGCSLARFNAL